MNTGNNLLFLVVSALLAFMAATGYAGMFNIKGVIPELLPPDEIFAGTPARFKVLLRNKKRYLPSFLIRLSVAGNGETLLPFVGSAEKLESTLTLSFPERGRQTVGLISVSSPFPVNFFTRYWNYADATTCIVYPRPLPSGDDGAGDDAARPGSRTKEIHGQDGELEGIREYSGAEPLRAIHWKLSARSEELLVKEFGSRSAPPLIIRLESLAGTDIEEKLSHAAWLIKQRVMEQPVGLELDDRIIQPASGRRHASLLLTELALYGHH
ncbi:DUF58 domain-containing protein [Trichlorobacter lovleyi]|uniref:DUF58 domain-containing protein n=1 Tax=Trichlorobacter lovleyi TaxID=313985 RepID=UPI0022409734|nr:DUF58 domain-containing protein [Trichlorobacter lovleyi]QOX79118.1 DUF58 domain-containing protein [Trichlorobacter lovleyi]